mmetsp:Transcript_20329/g.54308  ORF Transcript_20329/g.54308 Transcript_20329/m.54308 type:complete len:213 (+) Transcript_20329:282-920(+)
MLFQLRHALSGAKALPRIDGQQLRHVVLGIVQFIFNEVFWNPLLMQTPDVHNLVHRVLRCLNIPWRLSAEKLTSEHAQSPPVNLWAVIVRKINDFWCHVLRSAHKGVRLAQHEPGKAHVAQLDAPFPVQQHILKLQVSVGDVAFVEIVQGESNTGRVEHGRSPPWHVLHHQIVVVVQEIMKMPPGRVLQQKIHILLVLHGSVTLDDEGAIQD